MSAKKRFQIRRNPSNRDGYRIIDMLDPSQKIVLVPHGSKEDNKKRAREIEDLLNLGNERRAP